MNIEKDVANQFKDWHKKNRCLFYRRAAEISQSIPYHGLLLDVGCGDAEMMSYLRANKPGLKCYGIDVRKSLSGENVVKASCSNVPFKNSTFDIIVMAAVIEHIENQEAVIRDISHLLKEGGIIVITTPNPLYSFPAKIAANLGLKYKEGYDNSVSMKRVKEILYKNGFSIKMSRGFLILPFKINIVEKFEKILDSRQNNDFTFRLNQIIVAEKT